MKRGSIEYLRFIAVFMITLVISIPFLTSNAYASLTVASAVGKDGIQGIMAPDDSVNVTIHVTTSKANLTTDDVQILQNMGTAVEPFDSCEIEGGKYVCRYAGEQDVRPAGLLKYCACEVEMCPTVNVQCPSQGQKNKDIIMKVDGTGPTITTAAIDKEFISKEDPKVSFGITDTIGGGTPGCSGIKRVDIYVDGTKISEDREIEVPSCIHNIVNYKINNSDLPNDEIVICAVPEDAVGNVQAEYRDVLDSKDGAHCVGLIKDNRPPVFDMAKILDSSGTTELSMLSSKPTSARLDVQLHTFRHELKNNQVTADLKELGAGTVMLNCVGYQKPGEKVMKHYNCTSQITVSISETGTKTINMSAEDTGTNVGTGAFPFTFTIDDTGPFAYDVLTDKPYYGSYLLGPKNNTIMFLIFEEGAGINNDSVTINDGSNTLTEVSCGQHDVGIACIKRNYDTNKDSVTFTISGADLAGNPIDTSQLMGKNTLRVDNDPPTFKNATVVGDGPVVTEGSMVQIMAYVEDHYGFDPFKIEAQFDFAPDTESYFPADACDYLHEVEEETPEGEEDEPSWGDPNVPEWDPSQSNVPPGSTPQETEPIGKTWQCFWTIPGVVNQGPNRPMKVTFKIRDLAGNLDLGSQSPRTEFFYQYLDNAGQMWYDDTLGPVEVYGVDPTIVGAWEVVVSTPVPNAEVEGHTVGIIDSTLAASTAYRMWYPITLRSKTSGIEALSVTLKKDINGLPCYGDFFVTYGDPIQTNMQPIKEGDILRNSLELVFLDKSYIPVTGDYAPFSAECALGVIGRASGGDTVSIEMYVPFNVSGVVHPYDDIADKVHDKIMNHYNWFLDEEEGFTKFLLILQGIMDFLTSVCEIYMLFSALNVALAAIDNTIGVAFQNVGPLKAIAEFLNKVNIGADKVFNAVDTVATPVCSFLMCSEVHGDRNYNQGEPEISLKAKFSAWPKNNYGGTMPWCDIGYKALVDATTIEVDGLASAALQTKQISMFPNNIKDSFILSIICICIPGILNGLMTWRNIECDYITCLYKDSTMNTQLHICDELYHYSKCKYFVGEFFALIPFMQALEMIFKGLAEFLKKPLAWVLGGLAIACQFAVPQSDAWLACKALTLVQQVAEVYNRGKAIVQRIQAWVDAGITGVDRPDNCEEIIKLLHKDPRYLGEEEDADDATAGEVGEEGAGEDDPGYGQDADNVGGGEGGDAGT